ncbi:MAG: hypothetical protein U0822_00765 [Anaerolineae bacterium]
MMDLDAELKLAIEGIHERGIRLVYEFAGAGSLALAWLHAVPGSSRTLLEATDRYAAASMAELLGETPTRMVSPSTAAAMAMAAYRRALTLTDATEECLGLACTGALVSDRARRGADHCWVAVQGSARVTLYSLDMVKGARGRVEEENIVSRLTLRALADAYGVAVPVSLHLLEGETVSTLAEDASDPLSQLLAGELAAVLVTSEGMMDPDAHITGAAVLSGSFNPLHVGHERLAAAASQVLQMPALFELPVLNADKAPLGYAEIGRRLAQFRWRYSVILSRAALFVDKARLYPGCVFVIGYDTAVRLVAPRYYGSAAARDAALAAIREHGCRFLVAGRAVDGVFYGLADVATPEAFDDLFLALPEALFREDISSTEIRAKKAGLQGPPQDLP